MRNILLTFSLLASTQVICTNVAFTDQHIGDNQIFNSESFQIPIDPNVGNNCPHLDWNNPCYPRGATGPVGPHGHKGEKGNKGEKGERGRKGEKGHKGEKGEKGENGEPGEHGKRGHHGEEGPRGPRGSHGLTGPTGPTGPVMTDAAQYTFLQLDQTDQPVTVPPLGYLQFNTLGFNSGAITATPALPNTNTFTLPAGPNLYLINYGITSAMGPSFFVLEANGSTNLPGSILSINTDPAFDTLVSTSVVFASGALPTDLRVKNNSITNAFVGSTHIFPYTAAYISITKLN